MASKNNSRRSKIVHRQTFQNSNQIIKMTLRAIPKPVVQNKEYSLPPHFVRDCALKKEIQNVVKEKNNNAKNVETKNVGNALTNNTKSKSPGCRVAVEVLRKKSTKKHHNIVPQDSTWEAVLRDCSTVTSVSKSDLPLHSTEDDDPSQPVRRVQREQALPRQSDRNLPRDESSCSNSRMKLSKTRDGRHHGLSMQTREHTNKDADILERKGSRTSYQPKIQTEEGDIMVNNHRNEGDESAPPNYLLTQSEQAKEAENNRLLSDDVNASPFGESALQLLQQLKERLQSRGDTEGTDLVGVLEAFISGQGSSGGVGNPPTSAYMASPHYPPVFPTRDQNNIYSTHPSFQQSRKHKNSNSFPLNVLHEYEQNSKYLPGEVESDLHFEEIGEGYISTNVRDQQQMNNEFPQQTPAHPTSHRQDPYQGSMEHTRNKPLIDQASPHRTIYHDPQQEAPQETSNHGRLIREIARQNEVMAEQERIITELQKLSTQLIAQQEQIALKNLHQDKEVVADKRGSRTETQPLLIEEDSGVGAGSHEKSYEATVNDKVILSEGEKEDDNSSNNMQAQNRNRDTLLQTEQNYRSELLRLQTENAALLRELRSLRELVVNLEIQLTRAYSLLDIEKQSHSGLSVSKRASSAPNLDITSNQAKRAIAAKSSPLGAVSSQSETEADSAYEEKTDSHLTSKISSPHSDKQRGQDPGTSPSEAAAQKQNERDQSLKSQSVDNIPTDTALLRTMYINKESTVPDAIMNFETVPSNQFMLQQCIYEDQKIPADEVKSSASNGSPKSDVKASKVTHCTKKISKAINTQESYLAKPRGNVLEVVANINDLDPKPIVPLVDLDFSFFSTVSDVNGRDSVITQETSFLKGIKAPRHSRNAVSLGNKLEIIEDVSISMGGSHQPLESTRVQEGSPLHQDVSEDDTSLLIPVKADEICDNTSFQSVDKLD